MSSSVGGVSTGAIPLASFTDVSVLSLSTSIATVTAAVTATLPTTNLRRVFRSRFVGDGE
jgi:hypothetical protein